FQAKTDADKAMLIYGEDVPASPETATKIQSTANAEGVTVDTGVVKFTVRADGSGCIDDLSFKGKPLYTHDAQRRLNVMDAVHTASPADYHPMNRILKDAAVDPSTVRVNSVTVEHDGPLHSVVLIDGVYQYKRMGETIQGT